jgi:hypothetical protein
VKNDARESAFWAESSSEACAAAGRTRLRSRLAARRGVRGIFATGDAEEELHDSFEIF